MSRVYCLLDYETRATVSLKRSGAFEYAYHPETEILCVAWRIGTRETIATAPTERWVMGDKHHPHSLIAAMLNPTVVLAAHNVGFEAAVTKFVLSRTLKTVYGLGAIPVERWLCTASLAAALGLPRSLDGACKALGLKAQKDMAGHRLMLKMTKPRKPTKHDKSKWHQKPEDMKALVDYCVADIDAETELFLKLPPLTKTERRIWELDQAINLRGIAVDRQLVRSALSMINVELKNLTAELREVTEFAVSTTSQRGKILNWMKIQGHYLPDLTAGTVTAALASPLQDDVRRVLEIRQTASKTSTAKFQAFEERTRADGRLRDILVYHGAATGRWAGSGVQLQNLPRPKIADTDTAAEVVRTGDLEHVRMCYGDPMETMSSCLRSVLIAPHGRELFVADYASIEVRVLFWLAKHTSGLRAYREGTDLYKDLAADVYRIPVSEVSKPQRNLGKAGILGAGYGLGAVKFKDACKQQYGLEIDDKTAKLAIDTYRSKHSPVTKLWALSEKAAIAAIDNPGKLIRQNRIAWFMKENILFAQLPSGRRLAYHKPSIRYEVPKWGGEPRPRMYYWCVNGKTRKWAEEATYGGALTENFTSAIARDIMAEAMLRLEEHDYEVVLSVHDEIVAERDAGDACVEHFCTVMQALPEWARDEDPALALPIKAEGYQSVRYRK